MNLAFNKLLFTFLYEYDGNEQPVASTERREKPILQVSSLTVMPAENCELCLTKFEQVISNPKASSSSSRENSTCELRFWD